MKKIISLILIAGLSCTMLSGCSGDVPSTGSLRSIPSLTLEEIASTRLVETTVASNTVGGVSISDYVTDRIVVDATKLMNVTEKDEQNITALLENINIQLTGRGGNVLTDEYANYLLLEFAKTPYEWSQSSKNIVGFDPATRLYFVDVTYSTTNTYKHVVPDSAIPLGHPDSDTLRSTRYGNYISMVTYKIQNNMDKYWEAYNNFVGAWGEIQDIFDEQQGVSLYERTLRRLGDTGGIGRLTYSGLIRDNNFKTRGATMTVRYVLKYALNLGEETDLSVEALYLKNYEVFDSENLLNSYKLEDEAALEILKPFIDTLILSYNKSVEESNHIGLYQLFTDYSLIDKYYDEISNYTYNSAGVYNFEILERKNNGKEVAVKVNRVNQVRARGADMSLPTYDEVLIFNLLLGAEDNITIQDVYLVKSNLIGEPLSVIRNVTGISDQIQYDDRAFAESNKKDIEELIINFTSFVAKGEVSNSEFFKYVDIGISEATVNKINNTIRAIVPKSDTVYIVSWNTTTNRFCSVTIREILECNDGTFDTEAVLNIAKKDSEWKVIDYTRTVNIKTTEAQVNTENTTALYKHENNDTANFTTVTQPNERKDVEVNTPTQIDVSNTNPLNPIEESNEIENDEPISNDYIEHSTGLNNNSNISSSSSVSNSGIENDIDNIDYTDYTEDNSSYNFTSSGSGDFD